MKKTLLSLTIGSMLISGVSATTERVYIGTKKSKGIYVADLDAGTGKLSTPRLAAEMQGAGFITIAPDRQFLYSTGVASFKINADGSLTKVSEQRTGEDNSLYVSTDATGGILMTAYYYSGSVAAFKIHPGGYLSGTFSLHRHEGSGEHPKRQTQSHAHCIVPNPAGTYAYMADLGTDKIMIYRMNIASGTLTQAGEAVVPGGAMGPRHVKFDAAGKTLYALNELDLSISVFEAVENGQLAFLKTVPILPEGADKTDLTGAEIRIHPNGKFIYTSIRDNSEQKRDSISIFKLTDNGWERIGNTYAEVWYPRNFNIAPSGKWLIVGGRRSRDIAIFSVDSETGRISFTGQTMPFEGEPTCFEFL